MGRRKLEIKRITDKVSRQVTFSKRKAGLFKKAKELITLCSGQICIIVFSPGGRCFCYGFPNVEYVVSRYLNGGDEEEYHEEYDEIEEYSNDEIELKELREELAEKLEELKSEKQKGARLERGIRNSRREVDEICDLEELEEMKRSMEKVKEKVRMRTREIEIENEVSSSLLLLANSAGSEENE